MRIQNIRDAHFAHRFVARQRTQQKKSICAQIAMSDRHDYLDSHVPFLGALVDVDWK